MAKRSDFPRVDKDKYMTIDPRAVSVLATQFNRPVRYMEPCAGAGDLMRELAKYGHECTYAVDLEPGAWEVLGTRIYEFDAFNCIDGLGSADCFITNPPWSREVLHPLIEFLRGFGPTWLLFDADWAHTKQAIPYLPYCRRIVSVGRLRWIPGTTMQGKDNCAWYLFMPTPGETKFIGRKS